MRRFRISREDFEKLPPKRTSRFSKLMDKVAKTDDPHQVPLDKDERNAAGREKVRKQLRSLAFTRGVKIRVRTIQGMLFVQSMGEREEA